MVLSSNYVPQVQCKSKYRSKGFVYLQCEMSQKGADFPKSRRTKEFRWNQVQLDLTDLSKCVR